MIPLAHLERSSCGRVYWIAAMLIAFCFPGRGSATPIIQEVLYDGPGSDADDAFTELYGTPGVNLDGWALVGVNGGDGTVYRTVDLTGAPFPADGILVIATSSAAGEVLLQRDLAKHAGIGTEANAEVERPGVLLGDLDKDVCSLLTLNGR